MYSVVADSLCVDIVLNIADEQCESVQFCVAHRKIVVIGLLEISCRLETTYRWRISTISPALAKMQCAGHEQIVEALEVEC